MQTLQQDRQRLSILARMVSISQSDMPIADFLQTFLNDLAIVFGAEGVGIWMQRGQTIEPAILVGNISEFVPVSSDFSSEDAIFEQIISDKQTYAFILKHTDKITDEFIGIYKPIIIDDEIFGILKISKRTESNIIYEEDIAFLDALTGLIGVYLKQARLPRVLNKLEDIGRLLELSRAMFAELDVKKIAYTIANLMPSTISCERCIVAINKKGKLSIEAITGQDIIENKSVVVKNILDILSHSLESNTPLTISASEPESYKELSAEVRVYFENNPYKAIHIMPIKYADEVFGLIAIETSKESFSSNDLTLFGFAVNQAGTAINNARLFYEIPFAMTLHKASKVKKAFRAKPLTRQLITVFIIIFLLIMPFIKVNHKIKGECEVSPVAMYYGRANTEGILKEYIVKENDFVRAGQVVALLDDTEILKRLREAESRQEVLKIAMTKEFGSGRIADYEITKSKYQSVEAEIELLKYYLQNTRIVAQGQGIVLSPQSRLIERIGKPVSKGEEVLEIGNLGEFYLEVYVPEEDIKYVRVGQEIRFLLDAVHEGTFDAKVTKIREKAEAKDGANYFVVEAEMKAKKTILKPGMKGKAKIFADKQPLWFILLEDIINFFRMKIFF